MLTAKQEKFVRNLIEGMSQREAYKNSYDAENMSDKTIDNEAHLLFKNQEIAERYRELQDEIAKASILSATQRAVLLSDIARGSEEKTENKIKAIDTLNKMTGEYTTQVRATVTYEDRLKELSGEDEY